MAKKESPIIKLNIDDKKHLRALQKKALYIESLFDKMAPRAARIGRLSNFSDPEKPFYLEDFPEIKKKIDELMKELHDKMVAAMEEGTKEEWMRSVKKNDAMIDKLTSGTGINKDLIAKWKEPHIEALAAFQARKINGMGLSARVWELTQQTEKELELALDIGLGEGKSAAELSKDIRQYLKEPNKLFRRVRDKHGVLRLSKAAQSYHPGRGVYRSSYKNALRMAATETNMAYRAADHERWSRLDFVTGIEIKLSNNHPVHDICDELKGVYPKDFKFTGWHPWCRCHAVAKLADLDEFIDYENKILAGEDVSGYKFKGEIKQAPKNFNTWLKDNESKITSAKSKPFFITDNFDNGDVKKPTFIEKETVSKAVTVNQPQEELLSKGAEAEHYAVVFKEHKEFIESNGVKSKKYKKVLGELEVAITKKDYKLAGILEKELNFSKKSLEYKGKNATAQTAKKTAAKSVAKAKESPGPIEETAVNKHIQTAHIEKKMSRKEKVKSIKELTGVKSEQRARELRDAVESYSYKLDKDIRAYQSGIKFTPYPGCSVKEIKKKADDLEFFISNSPQWRGGKTYRGMVLTEDKYKKLINQLKKGEGDMLGTSSWSTNDGIARAFANKNYSKMSKQKGLKRVVLVSEKHTKATSIKHLSDFSSEDEVLVSKDCRYKLVRQDIVHKQTINKGNIDFIYLFVEPK